MYRLQASDQRCDFILGEWGIKLASNPHGFFDVRLGCLTVRCWCPVYDCLLDHLECQSVKRGESSKASGPTPELHVSGVSIRRH